ncbi:hypothetical protein [Nocardia mangyaensis]|uniref:hypothetical protein n=1 Tax=Nocardia mangyaensis TaxID=2213200 RepID=UPI00267536CD|nr:hypothetical protein [Nocardia mangyaensis]MDO3648866.1 hypothetical protein [Nocardia mangyaensis]
MKLRSFLPRRHINEVPLLPTIEPDESFPRNAFAPRTTKLKRDERLERLLTPTELDLVLHHQL